MIEAASAYTGKFGWRVFLVGPDCHIPIKHPSFEHGVHDATADAGEIVHRLALFPEANIALACGPGSGVLALDVDCKGEVDGFAGLMSLEEEFGLLPVTPRAETPSGGAHFLFAYPEGPDPKNRVGLKRFAKDGNRTVYPGLDVRAKGASIALAPSVKATGQYRWVVLPSATPLAPVPPWLLELMLSESPPPPPAKPFRLDSHERAARYVVAAVNSECSELARMGPASGRNLKLFQAAANLGELVGAGLLPQSSATDALERAAAECGLTAEDGQHAVRASIQSGMRKGMANRREVVL